MPHLEASILGETARGRGEGEAGRSADGTEGSFFEMEAWAGREATREGMNVETRSYFSGEGVGKEGWMLICVQARVCLGLGLPRGEPHTLTEGFADAISCWQGSV